MHSSPSFPCYVRNVFGFSFSELVVLIVVTVIVAGPKDLPKILRKMGQWSGKLRRMAYDLRAQSGIDDVLKTEGLADDINEIRKLARGELDHVSHAMDVRADYEPPADLPPMPITGTVREYPADGPDNYGALPDTAVVYGDAPVASEFAHDALYVTGDPNGALPEPALPVVSVVASAPSPGSEP